MLRGYRIISRFGQLLPLLVDFPHCVNIDRYVTNGKKKIQIIKWHIGVQQYKPRPLFLFLVLNAAVYGPSLGDSQLGTCRAPALPAVTEKNSTGTVLASNS